MRLVKFLAAFLVAFVLFIPMNANATTTFSDVPQDFWAAEDIYQFTDLEVIRGYEDGTFRPNQPVTRAQAAVILAGALQLDTENATSVNYKDVKKTSSAYDKIAAVTDAGIMQGSDGKFKPNKPLTRAQMAVVLTNAFDLEGNKKSSFKDVAKDFYAYEHIDAIFANGITAGYANGTFKPNEPTTRAHFAAFLARAMDEEPTPEEPTESAVAELLKKAYANEQKIDSYTFGSNVNFGLTLPESLKSEELELFTDMLEDIKVDISGAYQKDPMLMEANVKLTLSGEIGMTMEMPIVMTEEKMWFKLPNSPLAPLPEELEGKFIEFDLEELQELEGQPTGSMDLDLQTELALAINNLFVDQFADDFYNFVESDEIQTPNEIDVQKVVKFELTNETLQPFVEKLMTGFLPQFFELVQEPKYAEALGLTAEDIEMAQEGIAEINENLDEILQEIKNVLTINTFEEYIVIDQNDFIAYDVMDMDIDFTVEEETFGIKLFYDMEKSGINEDVTFTIGIPNKEDVLTMEELEDLFDDMFGDEDWEDWEDLEDSEL